MDHPTMPLATLGSNSESVFTHILLFSVVVVAADLLENVIVASL